MALNFLNDGYFAGKVGIGTESPSVALQLGNSTLGQTKLAIFNSEGGGEVGLTIQSRTNRAKLRVADNDSNAYVVAEAGKAFFGTSANGDATNITVLTSGNVGIGTASPENLLHVKAADGVTGVLKIEGGKNTVTSVGEINSQLDFGSNDASVWSSGNVGGRIASVTETSNGAYTGMAFYTFTQGASSPDTLSEKLRITHAGAIKFNAYDSTNLTGTPTYVLGTDASGNVVKVLGGDIPGGGGTVTGTGTDGTVTKWSTGGTGIEDGPITFSGNNSTFAGAITIGAHLILQQDGTNDLIKSTGNVLYHKANEYSFQDNSSNSWVTIKSGNVGIGVTGPTKALQVDGSIALTTTATTGAKRYHTYPDDWHSWYYKSNVVNGLSADVMTYYQQFLIRYRDSGNVFIINGNGDVGIGYTNPSEKLEVAGNIKIQAALLSNQENIDVDTGTETVASVAIATYTAAFFDFVIKKTTNVRSGTVYACHDGTTVQFTETSTQDLGDTSDVTLSVDISGTDMRLRATTTSDDWSIKSLIRAI